ncbi:MAG: hypothetical protein M3378_01215 [Actinomycetota bacterium]|nr:hypothetical protein [Actinomycetota bacterium]
MGAADAGESGWGVRRSPAATVACGLLVALLMLGSVLGREHLAADVQTWFLLTSANVLSLVLVLSSLRRTRLPHVMYAGILAVFLVGGIFQLYLLSYDLDEGTIISTQAPLLSFISSEDVAYVYGLLSLAFVVFCLLATVLATIPVRPERPLASGPVHLLTFRRVLVAASILYAGLTVLQIVVGFGQNALQNPSLPFPLIPFTLFFRLQVYPGLLLLGIWVFDRYAMKLSYLCVGATGVVALSDAYISTHRGAIVNFGLPILFTWLLTGRFTKLRKSIVIAGLVGFLLVAPVLSALRLDRVFAVTETPAVTRNRPSLLSSEALNIELGRLFLRVGGAGSMLFAIDRQDALSVGSFLRVYRPYGLTDYFTFDVVGVPLHATIAQGRSPTLIGMGTLVGGVQGLVMVVALTTVGLTLAWHWIIKRLWAWPVGLAILSHGALVFFSEGVTILFYKSILAIAVTEFVYRFVVRRAPSFGPGGGGEALDQELKVPAFR